MGKLGAFAILILLSGCGSGVCPLRNVCARSSIPSGGSSTGVTIIGTLDTSFNGTGIVTTGIAASKANGVAIQTDGKIVVAGQGNVVAPKFLVVRYTSSGQLDTGFATAGSNQYSINGVQDVAKAVAIQTDGKIVLGGYSDLGGGNFGFAVARFLTTGAIDTGFGSGGNTVYDFSLGGGFNNQINAIAIQPDGKIVVAGSYDTMGASNTSCALLRLNSDGSIDTGFGTAGQVVQTFYAFEQITALALQADGKIVAAGNTDNGGQVALVARFATDGSLDTSFAGGFQTYDYGSASSSYATAVGVQSDGKIVIAGYSNGGSNSVGLARLTTGGSFDTTYTRTTTWGGTNDTGLALAFQSDGKALIGGNKNSAAFGVMRLTTAGAFDTTFNSTGKVTTTVTGILETVLALAVQTDGKIVAAGQSNSAIAVTRYR